MRDNWERIFLGFLRSKPSESATRVGLYLGWRLSKIKESRDWECGM